MKTRCTFILLLSFLFFTVSQGFGQQQQIKKDTLQAGVDDINMIRYLSEKKLKFNLEVGTVFSTGLGSGNYFSTYVSPHVAYALSPRFNLNIGTTIMNGFPVNPYSPAHDYPLYNPLSPGTVSFVYVGGDYKVNDKLTLSGNVYKEFSTFNNPNQLQKGYNYNVQGMSMGVDYKVGKNAFIHGQIQISNDRNPYFSHPFLNPANNFDQSFMQSDWPLY